MMETIGFLFIVKNGNPIGDVQRTLHDAEDIAGPYERGTFYRLEWNRYTGKFSLSYEYQKG